MHVEQIYTGCLSQGAYYLESDGEVAIIDPIRDVQPYTDRAAKDGAIIKYVLETHFHADFVSGHLDLSRQTGAPIVYGPNAQTNFATYSAYDGEELRLGRITIKVLHTPGHTMESTCYLLTDETGRQTALFSGDTLFIGDVGRPDLAQKSSLTMHDLAGHLFDSLRTKLMPLPDDIIVYPAHGAGSACGKNMSKETHDTLGHQKEVNYALRADMTRDEFIVEVTNGLLAPPNYFPQNVMMNKDGYEPIAVVMRRGACPLSPDAFDAAANETDALILDVRPSQLFSKGFIPNAINIGLDGQFAPWVGALIPNVKQPLLLVCEIGSEQEAVARLARVGFDQVAGYLVGGFDAWAVSGRKIDVISSITADTLAEQLENSHSTVIDVRKPGEFAAEHVEGAINIPLDFINDLMAEFPKNEIVYVHCAGGYRSMMALSILRARGYENLVDVAGGYAAIKKTRQIETTDYICSSSRQLS